MPLGIPVIESRNLRYDEGFVTETSTGTFIITGEAAHFAWRVGPWAAAMRDLRASLALALAFQVHDIEKRWFG